MQAEERVISMGDMQDQRNYFAVLIAVVIGMALAQILTSMASVIRNRQNVKIYVPVFIWTATLFLLLTQYWYIMYTHVNLGSSLPGYLFDIMFPLAQYFAVAILLPKVTFGDSFDFEAHFFDIRKWFFGLCFVGILILLVDAVEYGRQSIFGLENAFRISALILLAALFQAENRKLHFWLPILALLLMSGFIIIQGVV